LAENRKPRFFYGYIIVAVAFTIQVLAWGINSTFGVFFIPLSTEFGWTRAMLSGASSLCFFLMGLVGIVAGRLNDRLGPRLVMTACGLSLGLGYLLMSQVGAIWHFYLFYGVIVALGMSGADVSLLSTVARWFVKRRGMMSGVIKAGAGVGMLIMPLVAHWLISIYGWRTSYAVFGSAVLALSVSAAQALRRDPGKKGLLPDGDEVEVEDKTPEASRLSLKQAIHTRQFWLLSAMFLLFVFCANTVIIHIYPHAVDLGMSSTTAANILATIGGASIAGRFVMGSAGDRVGNKLALLIDLALLTLALLWLQLAREEWMLYAFAALYGFAHGGLFALISPVVAELFGLSSHGIILGIVTFSGTVGGTIGPVLAGYIFDITGSYQFDFLVLAAASVIATLLTTNIKLKSKPKVL